MTSINEAPLPEGWQKMTTADGRTYFRNVAEGKDTIAFDFSVPLEDELVIPTVKPQTTNRAEEFKSENARRVYDTARRKPNSPWRDARVHRQLQESSTT
jgi:hypothetical protein